MANPSAAPDGARARIAGEMIERGYRERPPVDDIERRPVTTRRPHGRAQWDEVTGRWIEWDEVDDEWDPVEVAVESCGEAAPDPEPT